MGVILFLVALILLVILAVPGFIASMIILVCEASKYRFLHTFWKLTNDLFFAGAISIDIFGNVFFAPLFDVALRKTGGYKFGRVGETISSVLGKNQRDLNLTKFGKGLALILDTLDKDHCKKSIQEF